MKAIAAHLGFEFKSGVRDKSLLMMNYLFPLAFYVMMGLIMTKINPEFYSSMIPSMCVFAGMAATILALPNPMVTARESGIYRSYKINGISKASIIFIPAATTMMHMALVGGIIAATAPMFFGAVMPKNWGYFILTFGAFIFSCTGFAMLIGSCVKNSKTTILFSQLFFVPSVVIGGIMIPVESLSGSMVNVSRLLPSTHAMNALKSLTLNMEYSFNPYISIALLVVSGILAFGLAAYLFSWDDKSVNTKRNLVALLATAPFVLSMFIK